MKEIKETSYYIRRTWTDFVGNTVKVDHIGPYMENQEFAVAMQRGHDQRRQVPATEQITKWEWVQGKVWRSGHCPIWPIERRTDTLSFSHDNKHNV